MKINKLFLRWLFAFGSMMVFAVSGWGVVLDTDTFNADKDGWDGSGETWDAGGQRLAINRDQTGTKTFTFAAYPNQVVTVTLNATKTANWEAGDVIEITANGTSVYNSNTGGAISFDTTLNGSGQLALVVMPNTNSNDEDLYIDNVTITYTPAPEINVKGNSIDIVDGDGTPSATDNTNFGSANVSSGTVDKTFTIQNTGTADLTIGAFTITGDFSLVTSPAATVAAGGSTTFTVRFSPTSAGTRNGTISFVNNDGNENPYNFSITGTGVSLFSNNNWRLFTSVNYAGDHSMKGDIAVIGNSVMVPAAGGCAATSTSNNNIPVTYADIDSDATTFNSTSAELRLPASAIDKEIVWAGLYWQGYRVNRTDADKALAKQVLFKTPTSSNYVTLTSDTSKFNWLYVTGSTDGSGNPFDRFYFQGAVDVTNLVKAGGEGYYTVANIQSDTLSDYSSYLNTLGGAFGAWSIVIVYKDSSTTLKNISVFDGYVSLGTVGATADGPVFSSYDIPLSGFLTPTSGSVNSNFLVFAGEGDAANANDSAKLRNKTGTYVDMYNGLNPSNNIFNSKVSDLGVLVTNRNPNCENTVGIDIDKFAVGSNAGAGTQGQVIGNNQSNTVVRLASGGDGYFPGVFAFATDIYQPFISIVKSTDSANGTVVPNQTITYTANIRNTGNEGASDIVIYDNFDDNNLTRIDGTPTNPLVTLGDLLDRNTTSVYDSIVCHYGPSSTNCKSMCSVTASPFKVSCSIPALAIGDTAYMQFQTKMASNPDTGGQSVKVENQMFSTYKNALTGAPVDQSSSNIADAGQYIPAAASTFDAWETTLTKDTPKLYTQIVSNNFTFNVGTADGSTFNGAVCASVIDATGTVLSGGGYQCQDFTSASSFFSWTVTEAEKVAKIQIKSKSGTSAGSINLASPNWSGFTDSNSTDSFAVRPDHFVLSAPAALMQAGENYGMSVNAYDSTGGNAQGYDQDFTNLTASPATWWQRDSAAVLSTVNTQGTVTLGSGAFTNGIGAVPISFNDVGKFTLRVNDNNWAAVDSSDGTASDVTTIQGEEVMTFIPYRFNISAGTVVNNDGNTPSFTYLSSDLNMSARIPITVSAQNKQGATTQNYANNMYERMITITPSIASTDATTRGLIPITSGAINADADFTAGTKSIVYNDSLVAKFNFSRNPNVVVSPFDVYSSHGVGNDVNVSIRDADGVYGDKNQTLGGFATFVYGRLIPRDVRVFGSIPFTANAWYEVYNAPSINGTALAPSKNESMWYINRLHNDTTGGDGNITMISPVVPNTATPISSVSNGTGIETYSFNGIGNANIPYNGKAHINTDPWLWYGVNAAAYSDPAVGNTNCLTHPCFNITVSPDIGASGSAKTGATNTKTNKASSNNGTWRSTSDYAPAVR